MILGVYDYLNIFLFVQQEEQTEDGFWKVFLLNDKVGGCSHDYRYGEKVDFLSISLRGRKLEHRAARSQRGGSVVVVFAQISLLFLYNSYVYWVVDNLGFARY